MYMPPDLFSADSRKKNLTIVRGAPPQLFNTPDKRQGSSSDRRTPVTATKLAHRIFTDSDNVTWLVLAVYPEVEERRSERDRRTRQVTVASEQREKERRISVRRGMEQGWLVFKADHGRRRLAPIVEGWDGLPDSELDALCRRATPARRLTDPKQQLSG